MAVIIAIDGPSGIGKGTLAKNLAKYLQYDFLETGNLYRMLAFKIRESGKEDMVHIKKYVEEMKKNGIDKNKLRNESIAALASKLAPNPSIRALLQGFQRDFAATAKRGAILEGRDIGTVICPHADYKFFLEASVHIRAQRRHKELLDLGDTSEYMKVLDDLRRRDVQDRNRKEAPLKPAGDAVIVDTDAHDADQVLAIVIGYIKEATAKEQKIGNKK